MHINHDDGERVQSLCSYQILDTPADDIFDQLTRMAADSLGTPISLVSLIDDHRQWFKSRVGLEATETPRELAFCAHAIRHQEPFIIPDARKDPRFAKNPLVLGDPSIRFYAGVPIFSPDGFGLGTLCVIDRVPRQPTPDQVRQLEGLARLVGHAMEMHRKSALLEQALDSETLRQRKKELLASMLVHDLRSPLTGILGLASLESLEAEGETFRALQNIILAAERIERMAMDVLDLCLSDADELPIKMVATDIGELIGEQVRLQQLHARNHQVSLSWSQPSGLAPTIDPHLISRVVTNLLDNAIRHAPKGTEVFIELDQGPETLEIQIADAGAGVPEQDMEMVFDPGFRSANGRTGSRNFGLGLAFCRLAVEAHGGRIWVMQNSPGGARFCFTIPNEAVGDRT